MTKKKSSEILGGKMEFCFPIFKNGHSKKIWVAKNIFVPQTRRQVSANDQNI